MNKTAGTDQSKKAGARSKDLKENSDDSNQGSGKLKEFFHEELKDIYWAEKKLVQTLPKMAAAATSEELRGAFTNHLEETKQQVSRLEQVFKLLGQKPEAKKCDAMEGITEEGASIIDETEEGTSTRDVALIFAGQKAEHYEIATYGGLTHIARSLELDEIAELLDTTLEEEEAADEILTSLAEGVIIDKATEE